MKTGIYGVEDMSCFNLESLSNSELQEQLYKEFLFYDEELYELARIVRKQLPRKMLYRLISKLYMIRKSGSNERRCSNEDKS